MNKSEVIAGIQTMRCEKENILSIQGHGGNVKTVEYFDGVLEECRKAVEATGVKGEGE